MSASTSADRNGIDVRWPALIERASVQHGLVTIADLDDAGVPRTTRGDWARRGALVRLHSGVYALGDRRITRSGRRLAAVLACGRAAAASHLTSAEIYNYWPATRSVTHVVIPYRQNSSLTGPRVEVHRTRSLGPGDITTHDRIPIVTPPWSIVLAAGQLPSTRDVERLVHNAERERPLDSSAMSATLERARGMPGTSRLRNVLGLAFEDVTSPQFVDAFLQMCAAHGLPLPLQQKYLDAGLPHLSEADLYYPDARLVVELDGAAVHLTRRNFESDRRRDAAFLARGLATLRVTWRRLTNDRAGLARELEVILASRTA